jgi:hypothetical protein
MADHGGAHLSAFPFAPHKDTRRKKTSQTMASEFHEVRMHTKDSHINNSKDNAADFTRRNGYKKMLM